MSDELKKFYRELWAWVREGCPKHVVFHTKRSLCISLLLWGGMNSSRRIELCNEQITLFASLGAPTDYPFNNDGDAWVKECACGGFYQNQKRLAFIEVHAK